MSLLQVKESRSIAVEGQDGKAGAGLLRCDHVWSTGPVTRALTTFAIGARGRSRGYWLVLTDQGEVRLYKAHGKQPNLSRAPSFSASSPAELKAKVRRGSATLRFGKKSRMVAFTGMEHAGSLPWLAFAGELGHVVEAVKDSSERIHSRKGRQAAKNAWYPVLRGQANWADIEKNV